MLCSYEPTTVPSTPMSKVHVVKGLSQEPRNATVCVQLPLTDSHARVATIGRPDRTIRSGSPRMRETEGRDRPHPFTQVAYISRRAWSRCRLTHTKAENSAETSASNTNETDLSFFRCNVGSPRIVEESVRRSRSVLRLGPTHRTHRTRSDFTKTSIRSVEPATRITQHSASFS